MEPMVLILEKNDGKIVLTEEKLKEIVQQAYENGV